MRHIMIRIRIQLGAQRAYRQARWLAASMWRNHYRLAAPNWQPLDDATGVISQIDNMYSGVRDENVQMRTALLRIANMPEYDQDDSHRLRGLACRAILEIDGKLKGPTP